MKQLRDYTYDPNSVVCPFDKTVNKVINCDIIGSGYCNTEIDKAVAQYKGMYSNTHSNNNNGQLMSQFIEETRTVLRHHFNVGNDYVVLFDGSGSTMCFNHIVHSLNIDKQWIVLLSENEHNSNFIPWVMSGAKIEFVPTKPYYNYVDTEVLTNMLRQIRSSNPSCPIVFSCNIGSNVTGTLQNYKELYQICKAYKCIFGMDCAMCAPYTMIDANYCDFLAFSPHKFYGGDSTPGVLIAKKSMFLNKNPFCPGGGSIRIASKDMIIFSNNIETREQAGTPNILGIIKIRYIIQLKEQNFMYIHNREHELTKLLYNYVRSYCPNFRILDIPNNVSDTTFNQLLVNRLPVISFQVFGASSKPIHYNLIVKLLSDKFAIMARGGVQCCPILAQKYLKGTCIQKVTNDLLNDNGLDCEYGFVRISLNYLHTPEEIQRIFEALKWINDNAYQYTEYYNYNCKSNLYTCKLTGMNM